MDRRQFFKHLFEINEQKIGYCIDPSRRNFISTVIAFFATILMWPISKLFENDVQNHFREKLVSDALETEAGRQALAQAMVEPIRRQLDYAAMGRKILMVDELPPGAIARYEKECQNTVDSLSPDVKIKIRAHETN